MNKDLAFDITVTIVAGSHVVVMALITAWFALKKPQSWAQVRRSLRREMEWLRSRWRES